MENKITLGRDAGGRRHFLNNKPLHCGTIVEIFVFGEKIGEGQWLAGRFELHGDRPTIMLSCGELFPDSTASIRRKN